MFSESHAGAVVQKFLHTLNCLILIFHIDIYHANSARYDFKYLYYFIRVVLIKIRPPIKHCVRTPYNHAHNARIDENLYAQRSMTETVDSAVKRSLGYAMRARTWFCEFRETALMCVVVYNIKRAVKP